MYDVNIHIILIYVQIQDLYASFSFELIITKFITIIYAIKELYIYNGKINISKNVS